MVQINADGMTKRKSLARRVLLYAIIAFITSALIAAVLIMIGLIPLKKKWHKFAVQRFGILPNNEADICREQRSH